MCFLSRFLSGFLSRFLSGFLSRFLSGFLDFFVGHNLLMTIDNLLMLENFWEILSLLNYFLKCLWL